MKEILPMKAMIIYNNDHICKAYQEVTGQEEMQSSATVVLKHLRITFFCKGCLSCAMKESLIKRVILLHSNGGKIRERVCVGISTPSTVIGTFSVDAASPRSLGDGMKQSTKHTSAVVVASLPVSALLSALGSAPLPLLSHPHSTWAREEAYQSCLIYICYRQFSLPITFKTDISFSSSTKLNVILLVYFRLALLCAFLIKGKANLCLGTGTEISEMVHKCF